MSLLRFIGAAAAAAVLASCALAPDYDHDPAAVSAAYERAYEEQMDEGKSDGPGCSGVRVPDRGPFDHRIALTFDDGPNAATTPRVLALLREHSIPATFFMNGVRVTNDETRALVREIVEDPLFELGNHSWDHPDLATLPPERVASEMDRNTAVIEEAGGTPRYFRFPFGSSTCETAAAARERGYDITGWHVDSADWCYAAGHGVCKKRTFRYVPDEYRSDLQGYVMSQVHHTGGGIVLFHDIHASTVDALPSIIGALTDAGYTFTSLDDIETFPRLNGIEPPFVGDACSSDDDCRFSGGFCHAAGFCTEACAGYCPDAGDVSTFCIRDGETDGGICVPKASSDAACTNVPNTSAKTTDRFVGSSGAAAKTAQVCAPQG